MRSLKRGFVLATAVVAVSSASLSTAAAAAPGDLGTLDRAPDCITTRSVDSGKKIYAVNDCTSQKRVKFVWAFGDDSNCFTMSVGSERSHKRPNPLARFDGMNSC
jgi:hypothetical protein